LGRLVLEMRPNQFIPSSGPGLAILRIFQGIGDMLCKARPSSIAEFRTYFEDHGKSYFSSPWGVNVYQLKDGEIHFWKSVPIR
jgi:hypothetical protein